MWYLIQVIGKAMPDFGIGLFKWCQYYLRWDSYMARSCSKLLKMGFFFIFYMKLIKEVLLYIHLGFISIRARFPFIRHVFLLMSWFFYRLSEGLAVAPVCNAGGVVLHAVFMLNFAVTFSAEKCGFVFVKDYNLQKIITQEIAKNTLSVKVWA